MNSISILGEGWGDSVGPRTGCMTITQEIVQEIGCGTDPRSTRMRALGPALGLKASISKQPCANFRAVAATSAGLTVRLTEQDSRRSRSRFRPDPFACSSPIRTSCRERGCELSLLSGADVRLPPQAGWSCCWRQAISGPESLPSKNEASTQATRNAPGSGKAGVFAGIRQRRPHSRPYVAALRLLSGNEANQGLLFFLRGLTLPLEGEAMQPARYVQIAFLGLLVCPAVALEGPQAGIVKKIRADMAFVQKGSPLQVMGIRSSIYDLAEQVHVANVSARTIVRAQLGWTVDGCGKAPPRTAFVGLPMDMKLEPGQWMTIGRQGITLTDTYQVLNHLGEACGEVIVGVVFVEFSDGSRWSYPLGGKNRFEVTDSKEIIDRLSQPLREMREKIQGSGNP